MTINAGNIKSEGKRVEQPLLEPGSYPARVVQVIDEGLQPQEYMGEKKAPKNQISVTYELLDEFIVDEDGNEIEDKPRWVSEDFTLNSLDSDLAKSTKRYYALDPEAEHGGDWGELLGVPCMVELVQNFSKGKGYNNVQAVSTMRAKDAKKAAPLVNDPRLFTMDDPNMEVYNSLPQWIKDKIESSLDFEGSKLDKLLKGDSPKSEEVDEDDEWDFDNG